MYDKFKTNLNQLAHHVHIQYHKYEIKMIKPHSEENF